MRMHLHHLPEIVLALLAAVVVASGSIAPTRAAASPTQHAVATVTEGTKVILPQSSLFAPAITLLPSEGAVVLFDLAWTGTDAAHQLNVAQLQGL